jgi:hypothetical protein
MRLSYSNVISSIALFVAFGGTSYAVTKGSIGTRAIKDNSIRSRDVRSGTLTGDDIRESSLATVPAAVTAGTANLATQLSPPEDLHVIGALGEPDFKLGCGPLGESPSNPVGFYKDHEGIVHLHGAYSCDTARMVAFNLPPGYRPGTRKSTLQAIACLGGDNCTVSNTTMVEVAGTGFSPDLDGGVIARAGIVVLDGVSFRAGG